MSRKAGEAQERTQAQGESRPAGGTWAGPKHAGPARITHGRGVAGQAGRTAVHEARAHRCEYVRARREAGRHRVAPAGAWRAGAGGPYGRRDAPGLWSLLMMLGTSSNDECPESSES